MCPASDSGLNGTCSAQPAVPAQLSLSSVLVSSVLCPLSCALPGRAYACAACGLATVANSHKLGCARPQVHLHPPLVAAAQQPGLSRPGSRIGAYQSRLTRGSSWNLCSTRWHGMPSPGYVGNTGPGPQASSISPDQRPDACWLPSLSALINQDWWLIINHFGCIHLLRVVYLYP